MVVVVVVWCPSLSSPATEGVVRLDEKEKKEVGAHLHHHHPPCHNPTHHRTGSCVVVVIVVVSVLVVVVVPPPAAVVTLVITLPVVVVLGVGMDMDVAAAEVVRINEKKGGELTVALPVIMVIVVRRHV